MLLCPVDSPSPHISSHGSWVSWALGLRPRQLLQLQGPPGWVWDSLPCSGNIGAGVGGIQNLASVKLTCELEGGGWWPVEEKDGQCDVTSLAGHPIIMLGLVHAHTGHRGH